jgi:tRNA U34 5-methylaminomethyl-2-thiouridine-forming methyltransferase MnmC
MGLNLAAALEALDGSAVKLVATSLERDRAVIQSTLDLAERPETQAGPWEIWHARVRAALAGALETGGDGAREVDLDGRGSLRLLLGDARVTLASLEPRSRFDAVFLDPFGPRVEGELWQGEFLAEVAARMAPGALLSTYSASFTVRRALAAAGLEVGRGARVGSKSEGTLAGRGVALAPLAPRTARRLARAREALARHERT